MRRSLIAALPAAISGLFGATFLGTIVGAGVLDPREVRWVFQADWQWHFLGWQFFRNEPWQIPPGLLRSYIEPIGSAIGYTDSIPLVALLLKPIASLLPNPIQYLGVWLLICFVLQGAFGSLLIAAWTKDPVVRALGGCLFVLVPTLLTRYIHPALCSHFVLLWALWLAVREPLLSGTRLWLQYLGAGLVSGLLHPYLAVMVLLLLVAASAKRAILSGRAGALESAGLFVTTVGAVFAGWWASGLLTVTSGQNIETQGLGIFSTNLLALVNPGPRSRFMPELPWLDPAQSHEGYHYLGLALLSVCMIGAVRVVTTRRRFVLSSLPLVTVLVALALFSLSPRVTFGNRVLLDLLPYTGDWSTFRASARFFWPMAYAMVAAAIGIVATTLNRGLAVTILAGAVVFQLVELQPWHSSLYYGFRNPAFLGVNLPTPSDDWHTLLPEFDHVRMYWPQFCGGPVPIAMPFAAYLAGLHGLGLNDGFAARMNGATMTAECQRLQREFASGVVNDDTVYLVATPLLDAFQKQADVRCHPIDGAPVCVSRAAADRLSLKW